MARLPHAAAIGLKMRHAPVEIVDTASVAAPDAQHYVTLLRDRIVPVMIDAGASLVALRATSGEIGEDVLVQSVWRVNDHSEWNCVRKNFFLDPRWHVAWAEAAPLRRSGTRRFFYPIECGDQA
jgi:hypothetical protein